jgi:CheY-like chemotaxis protein
MKQVGMKPAPRVLVVDDEQQVRTVLVRWLTGWRYRAREAGSAREALDAMTVEPAHIVLCDINMPDHDGLLVGRAGAGGMVHHGRDHGDRTR